MADTSKVTAHAEGEVMADAPANNAGLSTASSNSDIMDESPLLHLNVRRFNSLDVWAWLIVVFKWTIQMNMILRLET
jgi:hypothetical protein